MRISVNEQAMGIVREIMDRKDDLQCEVLGQENGTTLIDIGIAVKGGVEAGRLAAEVCLGGLGAVRVTNTHIGDLTLPSVVVGTDQPKIALMGSQYAGWAIRVDSYFAMGSGPARALAGVENELFTELDYRDDSSVGVICLETREPPPEKVTQFISDSCGISASDLYCIMAPTASIAGSVLMSARIAEVGVRSLYRLGFGPAKIRTGHGTAPISPVAKDDREAKGVTNDCILYGGRAFLFVKSEDGDDMAALVEKASSSASTQYGQPLYALLKSVGFNVDRLDPDLFSPAEITVNDVTTGLTLKGGYVNPKVLRQSLEMK
jgi:methenyltetrahydromethanopterin cyclohydrolase